MKHLYLILLFILAGCSQNIEYDEPNQFSESVISLTQDELVSIAYENPGELNADEVKMIASDFLRAVKEAEMKDDLSLTRSVNTDFTFNVSSKSYYTTTNCLLTKSDGDFKLPIYEISISSDEGNGVIYVSADKRNAEVISYIPYVSNDEEIFLKSGSAFLLEWAKASAYERFVNIEKVRQELHDITIEKVSKALKIDKSEVKLDNILDKITLIGVKSTPITTPTTQIVSMCSPLVKTKWAQDSPYNLALPVPDAPSPQAHVYAGCAVTAACQLMTAIKPNLTLDGIAINWDYLTKEPQIGISDSKDKLDMVAKLHSWVYKELDATPSYNSSGIHDATGVTASSQVWFYNNYFNHSENYTSYDPDALLRSLNASRPSLIRGQGHAWIIDGYIIAEKAISSSSASTRAVIVQYYDMFWHANLGWSGMYNGYYKLKADTNVDFESGNYKYSTEYLSVFPGLYKTSTNYSY